MFLSKNDQVKFLERKKKPQGGGIIKIVVFIIFITISIAGGIGGASGGESNSNNNDNNIAIIVNPTDSDVPYAIYTSYNLESESTVTDISNRGTFQPLETSSYPWWETSDVSGETTSENPWEESTMDSGLETTNYLLWPPEEDLEDSSEGRWEGSSDSWQKITTYQQWEPTTYQQWEPTTYQQWEPITYQQSKMTTNTDSTTTVTGRITTTTTTTGQMETNSVSELETTVMIMMGTGDK
ncbi:hypothetical protein SNEBB_011225 [Seison nebaliae]|nr:hypothetical protein SNEBB_011225 [Seison nebaliae]